MQARLDQIQRIVPAAETAKIEAARVRADSVGALFDESPTEPTPGETALSYRKRLVRQFAKHSKNFRGVTLAGADEPTVSLVENQVYADAQEAARSEKRPGRIVAHTTREFGRLVTRYHGDPLAWMAPFMSGGNRGRFVSPRVKSTPGIV